MSKRSRVSDTHEDVLLPVELIHGIQSLLPFKESASTCILSKSWLRAWYTIPNLKLIPPEPDKLFSTYENETKYMKLIHNTLERYHKDNIPIESFHLQLRLIEDNLEDAENWIRLVVSKSCLKDLSLNITVLIDDSLTLPNELFSSQNLSSIHVKSIHVKYTYDYQNGIRLRICKNPVINCVASLRVMDFESVIITQDVFQKLLSTCTLLEKIRLYDCEGLKNVKVKNHLRLRELDIFSNEYFDSWEINNVPSLRSFLCHMLDGWRASMPFQMDSLSSVTQLHIDGVIIDKSFFDTVKSKFPWLETLTLGIGYWRELEDLVITSVSLKWLTLDVSQRLPGNVQVHAPRLLTFTCTGNIPPLMFPAIAPEQINLTYSSWEPMDHSFFCKMRETLNLSNKFEINLRHESLDSVVPLDIDVDDLRRRASTSFPVTNVQLSLETRLDEHVWEESRFFDAFFLICRPSYIRSSNLVIRKMMEGNTTDLIDVQLKNPNNGKWEALTESVLDILTGDLDCKLNWFPL